CGRTRPSTEKPMSGPEVALAGEQRNFEVLHHLGYEEAAGLWLPTRSLITLQVAMGVLMHPGG
ncbi:MAG: hypothetical protein JWR83_696, partial [Aeromicrobium sp.]|nr:hypothetical protein [Aeromicrobium sp.]